MFVLVARKAPILKPINKVKYNNTNNCDVILITSYKLLSYSLQGTLFPLKF